MLGASLLRNSRFPARTRLSTILLPPRCSAAVTKAFPAPRPLAFLLSCALSSQASTSTAQPKMMCLRWRSSPPKQWWHSPQVLRLVTLQCTVFYSLGLEPDPLRTPAGRPGLAITSPPPPPLSAAVTWASLNKQFTFSQAGFVPGFLSVQRPRPDRISSVCTIVSRHHSIQNCELICK